MCAYFANTNLGLVHLFMKCACPHPGIWELQFRLIKKRNDFSKFRLWSIRTGLGLLPSLIIYVFTLKAIKKRTLTGMVLRSVPDAFPPNFSQRLKFDIVSLKPSLRICCQIAVYIQTSVKTDHRHFCLFHRTLNCQGCTF